MDKSKMIYANPGLGDELRELVDKEVEHLPHEFKLEVLTPVAPNYKTYRVFMKQHSKEKGYHVQAMELIEEPEHLTLYFKMLANTGIGKPHMDGPAVNRMTTFFTKVFRVVNENIYGRAKKIKTEFVYYKDTDSFHVYTIEKNSTTTTNDRCLLFVAYREMVVYRMSDDRTVKHIASPGTLKIRVWVLAMLAHAMHLITGHAHNIHYLAEEVDRQRTMYYFFVGSDSNKYAFLLGPEFLEFYY